MALKLLYERQLGKESRLAHYVENLPRNFSSPLTWTNVELAALQYPFLQQEVQAATCPYLYQMCVSQLPCSRVHCSSNSSSHLPNPEPSLSASQLADKDGLNVASHAPAGDKDEGRTEAGAC